MHGHTCDGASSTLGEDSGVAKRLNDENEKVLLEHYLGHSASLSVKSTRNTCRGMRDHMDDYLEIVKLIKFSPKRETVLEKRKMKDATMEESHEDA